jgi:hypothetical protein
VSILRGHRVERVEHDLTQRDRANGPVRLAALFEHPSGVATVDPQNPVRPVYVAPMQPG